MSTQQPTTTAARWAVLAMFFINGGIFASWAARIPAFQNRFELSEGELGLTLLAISAGVVSALAVASTLIARFGSKVMTFANALLTVLTLALLPLMPNPISLWIMLFMWGAALAMMDMAMNAQAAEVERRRGKPTMSSFHASFSAGGIAGALIGAALASQDVSTLMHFGVAAALFAVIALIAVPYLLRVEGEQRHDEPVFSIPPRAVWALGGIAMFAALGEGAVGDWSAVYLEDVTGAPVHIAALGYAAFSTTMTIGRVSGDWMAHHVAPSLIARIGGVVAAAGMLAAVLIPTPIVALIGFGAVGIGLANIVPLAFSAAGNTPGVSSSKGITGVATISYAAFLAGPPFIGQLADLTSQQVALGAVGVLIALIAVFAGALRRVSLPVAAGD